MSSLNEEVLITFEELKHLQIEDIPICVDKYNALSICEKSLAPPSETYSLWVQKLFKAYDIGEFSSDDWHMIFGYLGNVLNNFVKKLNPSSDISIKQLNLWWLDTQELLKWLEAIITSLDVCILCLILTFVLEIIIKTCQFTDKRNLKPVLTVQQLVINMVNNFMFKMPIINSDDFEGFNKVLCSICDVGMLISSADIKTSIETWRVVAKLSDKYTNCYQHLPEVQTENAENLKWNWHNKAIFGIFKELTKMLKSFVDEDLSSNNDNILQVAQFYLKLIKVLLNHSSDKLYKFPAIKEFFELYTLCNHQLKSKNNSKIKLFVNTGLYEIFLLIYHQPGITEHVLQHLKYDADDFYSCDLIVNYLQINIEHCRKDLSNVEPDVRVLLHIYDILFEGPLIFIDDDKYSKILQYYVALTIQDCTNEMHKQLCQYVLDTAWIKAYVSSQILKVYYSYLFTNQTNANNLPCLEFWLNIWNKLNNSTTPITPLKMLIEFILKTIFLSIPDYMLTHYCNNLPNFEIVMLTCGNENSQSLQYFQTNLTKNLRKMQECQIDKMAYRELINLLDICLLKPDWVSVSIKEHLLKAFMGLCSIPTLEIHTFCEFLNKCFRIFCNLNDKQLNNNVLQSLMDNLQYIENICSVFLIEFLLKQTPQSTNLLKSLKSTEIAKIINLMDNKSLGNHKKTINLQVFQVLANNCNVTNSYNNDIEQITKKPRLGECKFSNIKFILNELNSHTQHLLKLDSPPFDTKDYELLNCIKNNIEKCLNK